MLKTLVERIDNMQEQMNTYNERCNFYRIKVNGQDGKITEVRRIFWGLLIDQISLRKEF